MTRFTYIYDTYCGWCYGAAPVIDTLIQVGADLTVMHRNLFHGSNAPRMGDGFGRTAEQYDRRIADLTGQIFSEAYVTNILKQPDEILISDLTAQAAALVHDQGAIVEMALAYALQKARYVDGISASNASVVTDAISRFGIDAKLNEGIEKSQQISAEAAAIQLQFGIQGVPVLLRHQDDQTVQIDISKYYKQPEKTAALVA